MPEREFEPSGMLGQQIFGLPVEREIIFSNYKKVYKKRIEKRQRKLIVKIHFLKPFLKRGEKILLVTTGYSPLSSLAQYVTGFLFVYLKRSLFVFTNYRILHIPTTPAYKYNNAIAQIAYAGCRSLALKGGSLIADYGRFGKSEKFKGIPVSERKKIKALLKKLPISGTKNDLADRIHLCPNCTHRLENGKYVCGNCQLKFKSKLAARIIAIMMPGGGYFYTRHYLIGILNAGVEGFLIIYLVYIALTSGIPEKNVKESLYYLIPLALIYLAVKSISLIHATHFIDEFIPKEKLLKPNGNSSTNEI
jgi:hypothetical protein